MFLYHGVKIDIELPIFNGIILDALKGDWYESPEIRSISRVLAPGDTLLEVGSGCGVLSSFVANLDLNNVIYAVEADPTLIPVIKLHHLMNNAIVSVHHEVLGNCDGVAEFYIADAFWASSLNGQWGRNRMVSVPMASFARRLREWCPDVIMMDIEGGELELLQLGLAPCVRTIVAELHEDVYGSEGVTQIMDLMTSTGFSVDWHDASVVTWRR